jgi:aminoglycoside/choline kinase family phosphotransferase
VDPGSDPADWQRWFALVAVHRKLKDAGRFVFIDRVKGNPGFLPFVGRSLAYARRALGRLPGMRRLGETLGRIGGLDEP